MFSHSELLQYSRHILLPEIGYKGQIALKNASALIVGAGGLGCPVLQYLTAAGVGRIGIIDFDKVDRSNLQRQILYSVEDIGKQKADTAIKKLSLQNPNVYFDTHNTKLTSLNALKTLKDYEVIIDCSDNFPTRYLVNDACLMLNKPFVFGALYKFEGQVSVFNYNNGPTYRCLFPDYPDASEVLNCSEIGVMGVMAGIIGSLQACEAIKIIAGVGDVLSGKLLMIDTLKINFNIIHIEKNKKNRKLTKFPDYDELCSVKKQKESVRLITAINLQKKINDKSDLVIVDIREPYEFKDVKIQGSTNIPMLQIEKNIHRIPRNKPVCIVCNYGIKSQQVIKHLRAGFGYTNLLNLKGGIIEWIKTTKNIIK